jgi:hypothetical protein
MQEYKNNTYHNSEVRISVPLVVTLGVDVDTGKPATVSGMTDRLATLRQSGHSRVVPSTKEFRFSGSVV